MTYAHECRRISTLAALWACDYSVEGAAAMLGLSSRAVYHRIKRWSLDLVPRFSREGR